MRSGVLSFALRLAAAALVALTLGGAWIAEAEAREAARSVDRVVVRFTAPEAGGRLLPHFVFERELALEARLLALADPAHPADGGPFRRHHLQAALERHIAETLLASLAMTPEPTAEELGRQSDLARVMQADSMGGEARLLEAARAEGIGTLELRALFRRRARASLYLDRMVAPMLTPSVLELRRVHAEGKTPFSSRPFDEVVDSLSRYYVAQRLHEAALTYFQNARARLRIEYLGGRSGNPGASAPKPR